ncbi:MAG TPA: HAD-IA family hydrolase [Thermomicrobiaceae bacterium]|nr:HAD-IA family hydrolase [Thermomicrobiaceae bacterium]
MSSPCFAVELITFDAGGTLLTLRPDQAREWSVVLGELGLEVPEERIAAALERERPLAAARRARTVPATHAVSAEAGEERRRQFIAEVLLGAGVAPDALPAALEAIKAALDSARMYLAYPDALPALRALWERGLKLGAVTNAWPSMPRILLDLGFGEYLGFWVVSEMLGVEKPGPAIFERALEIGGAPPERALQVGDDLRTDVAGARAAGMQAVLLDRSGAAEPAKEAAALDVPVIRTLAALPDLVP